MRSPGLVVMGLAGLLVVGYAFYVLLAPPSRSGGRSRDEASKGAEDVESVEAEDGARSPRTRKGAGPVDAKPKTVVDAQRPKAGPAPRPEASMSLAEARRQFADYMAELDGLAARDAELSSPEWVELYKRGHDVLLPLQQNLDWQVPEQARELKMANEDMRARLNKIDPNRPEPPPVGP